MKKTLLEVRETIRLLLRESVCPACSHPGAYIGGMNNVECPNPQCRFYSHKQEALEGSEKICVHCGEVVAPQEKVCPNCGEDPHDEQKSCKFCGSDITGRNTCSDCNDGEDLDDEDEESFERELEWFDVEQSFPEAAKSWEDMTDTAKHDDYWVDEAGMLHARPLGSRDERTWDPDGDGWVHPDHFGTKTILGPSVKF